MPTITFLRDGTSIQVPAGGSFLKACQDADAPHDFGCTVGSCGTCTLVVVVGGEKLAKPTDDELETVEMATGESNARLGCQMIVNCDLTVRPAQT